MACTKQARDKLKELAHTCGFQCPCGSLKWFVAENKIPPNNPSLLWWAKEEVRKHEEGKPDGKHQLWQAKNADLWKLLKTTGEATPAPAQLVPAVPNNRIVHIDDEKEAWQFVLRQMADLEDKNNKRKFKLLVFESYLTSLNLPPVSTNFVPDEWLRETYLRRFLERDDQCRVVSRAVEATHIIDRQLFVAVPSSQRREQLYKIFTFDINEDSRLPYEVVERAPTDGNRVVYAHVSLRKMDSALQREVMDAWRYTLCQFGNGLISVDVSSARDGRLRFHTSFPVRWTQLHTTVIPYFTYLLDSRIPLTSGNWTQRVNAGDTTINFSYKNGLRLTSSEIEPLNNAAVFKELKRSSFLAADTTKEYFKYKIPEDVQRKAPKPYRFLRGDWLWCEGKGNKMVADWTITRSLQDPVLDHVRRAIQTQERWKYARVAFIRRFTRTVECVEVFLEGVGARCTTVGCPGCVYLQYSALPQRGARVVCPIENKGQNLKVNYLPEETSLVTLLTKLSTFIEQPTIADLVKTAVVKRVPKAREEKSDEDEGDDGDDFGEDERNIKEVNGRLQLKRKAPGPKRRKRNEYDDDEDYSDDDDDVRRPRKQVKTQLAKKQDDDSEDESDGDDDSEDESDGDGNDSEDESDGDGDESEDESDGDGDDSEDESGEDGDDSEDESEGADGGDGEDGDGGEAPQPPQAQPPQAQPPQVMLDHEAIVSMWHQERNRLGRSYDFVDDDEADVNEEDVNEEDVNEEEEKRPVVKAVEHYPFRFDEFKTLCTVEFTVFWDLPTKDWDTYDDQRDNGGGVCKPVVEGLFMKAWSMHR